MNTQTGKNRFLVILQVLLICSLVQLSSANASVFVPEPTELNRIASQNNNSRQTAMENIATQAEPGTDYVQVDDMRFKVNPLIQNNGFSGTKWTGGIVYYAFDANVNSTNKQRWLDAAAEWSAVAKLTFILRSTQAHYINVISDDGNWSYVGMIGGRQDMGIYNWIYEFVIAHEIGHALGLSHEQSRADRDGYVTILWNNIQAGMEGNFDLTSTVSYGAYDFDSVMHYSRGSFSSNGGNTIEPLPAYSGWLNLMGQHSHLSSLDKSGMASRYGATVTKTSNRFLLFIPAINAGVNKL